jgi:REP element-mobilizing transposase RayT
MSQSLVQNVVHLVYSTKNREPWLSKEHRDGLFRYQAGIFKAWDSPALLIGGVDDHVHALFCLSKNQALKKVVEEVKKASSKWMKSNGPQNYPLLLASRLRRFLGKPIQPGYCETLH